MSNMLAKLLRLLKLNNLYFKLAFYAYFLHDLRMNHVLNNLKMLRKKKGYFITRQGYKLFFNEKTKPYILDLHLFHAIEGVEFKDEPGYWRCGCENGILITPDGIKFKIESFDRVIFAETFLYDVHYTPFLKDKIVIQAGGFVGDTALYYANKGAIVYSLEPQPSCYKLALENIKLNPHLAPRITFLNYALGKDEEIEFPDYEVCNGGASIFSNYTKKVRVKSISLFTLLEEFNINNPYLLDIDIKGKEFGVINDEAIKKFKKVRIEYTTEISEFKGKSLKLLIDKLKEYGFNEIRIYKHNSLVYDLNMHGTIEAYKT